MIKDARAYRFNELISAESSTRYEIPKYQREYVWGKNDWETLFDDLVESDAGHFLGSIICVNQTGDSLSPAVLTLIDGQQRFTTLSLLMAAIYTHLASDSPSSESEMLRLASLKTRLVRDNLPRIALSIQGKNFDDYRWVLRQAGILDIAAKPSYASLRRISKCFEYFKEQIRLLDRGGVERNNCATWLLDRVYSAVLVKIEVLTTADAFTLFETINNRGIPLSAIDLIKNKIMATMETIEPGSIDDVFERWTQITDNIPDYSWQERFLRQYYNAFKITEASKKVTKSKLIEVFEREVDQDARGIFADLCNRAEVYASIIPGEGVSNGDRELKALFDLGMVGAAPAYTFLLYLYSEPDLESADRTDIVRLLVNYFVRRNLLNFPATRELDNIFISLVNECRDRSQHDYVFIKEFLTAADRFLGDEVFRDKLLGPVYDDNAGITRFILCGIEEANQTKETSTNLWEKRGKSGFVWTIEHILPQGRNLPPEWVQMIADGDSARARSIQEEHVHRLGNLTLSGYNPKLSNAPFQDKRDAVSKRTKKAVGYKNGLHLNTDLATRDDWSGQAIEDRSQLLADEALELFSI